MCNMMVFESITDHLSQIRMHDFLTTYRNFPFFFSDSRIFVICWFIGYDNLLVYTVNQVKEDTLGNLEKLQRIQIKGNRYK